MVILKRTVLWLLSVNVPVFFCRFRFDSEIQRAKEELNHERTLKDKINREKEKAVTEKYQLEHDLSVSLDNVVRKTIQPSALQRKRRIYLG